jgi:hypothetical protein
VTRVILTRVIFLIFDKSQNSDIMKNKALTLLTILVITVLSVTAQTSQKKLNPVGTWKFEAPSAQEGYNSGVIAVTLAEKKHAVSISFTGSEYKIPGENVKLTSDSLYFSVNLEGESINMLLRMTPDNKMAGKAVYSGGEVPLTLVRQENAQSK